MALPVAAHRSRSFSRFDLTVLAVLLACGLAVSLLAWRAGQPAKPMAGTAFLYVTMDAQGGNQLDAATLSPDGQIGDPRRLLDTSAQIGDLALTPDGKQVVFSALDNGGVGDLWLLSIASGTHTKLLACPDAACSNPHYAPNGRLVAYTRRKMSEFASAAFSPPRLWLLDVASQETAAVFTDTQQLAYEPRWSADGRWLSYIVPDSSSLGVLDLENGETQLYPNAMGEPGAWSPSGPFVLTTNSGLQGEDYITHLLVVDVRSQTVTDLSGERSPVIDSGPSYSPDGAQIAFRRKWLSGPQATRGQQIWYMRRDGRDPAPLTADEGYDFGNPVWSSDGHYLLMRGFPLNGPEIVSAIWLADLQTGAVRQLVKPGDQPVWLQ